MIAELGSFSLVLAIVAALLLIVAAAGPRMRLMCRPLALAFAAFMALAFAALLVLFARIDTSVAVVAAYATPDMPLAYRLSAAWGHHEGSMLLFAAVLAVYTAVLACGGRPTRARGTALAIMGALGAMLALYTHFLSSPFARLNPAPMPAAGFNPILEDPLLVIHPPILYLGLAGLALPFAWTLSMLVTGRGGARLRPSLFMPFAFLTAGIALGAFWSFYELGWGGYWAWDPVENSALIPWLLVAAALHAPSRHRVGPSALLLTVLAFLSVLGGLFMVRAGVIDSIHTFAAAPGRGIALLGIFVGVSLASTALFVLRAPATGPISRSERVPALASMLLAGMAATVALGTLYPIIYSPLTGRAITIGPAYYTFVLAPFALLLLLMAVFAMFVSCRTRRQGAALAHMGLILFAMGAVGAAHGLDLEVSLVPGQTARIGTMELTLIETVPAKGPNWSGEVSRLALIEDGRILAALNPERRVYANSDTVESDLRIGLLRTIQAVVPGVDSVRDGARRVRLMIHPLALWIWIGAGLIALGAILGWRRECAGGF